ncbi:hypothetical protein [Dactylosporangium sp. NPDC006015]|uniref:hypothetical protein n=1 Tax=Dactylosporangium sp. NPDC006015 TaxID=3154576 RepID=UPI0033A9AEE8
MLLRLACLAVTNTFVVLRLLPMSNRDEDVEILALRHQIRVLERQLGKEKSAVRRERPPPLRSLPAPITDPNKITRLDIRRRDRLGGILHEYQHSA